MLTGTNKKYEDSLSPADARAKTNSGDFQTAQTATATTGKRIMYYATLEDEHMNQYEKVFIRSIDIPVDIVRDEIEKLCDGNKLVELAYKQTIYIAK